jgi:catechol 2,3-dioxygenase-like lactoylglutathione lyase family enzyme
MRPHSSFAGAAIEVSDLARSVAFHRLWLPMLGFRRVWANPDRVMWSRGYDHFVMRQAKDGVSYGPGALWLAVSAESRAQVDQVHAELRDAGAEILQPPKELDYFAPGYYSVGFRDPDGVPIEVVHRWDELASRWGATSSSLRRASRHIRP